MPYGCCVGKEIDWKESYTELATGNFPSELIFGTNRFEGPRDTKRGAFSCERLSEGDGSIVGYIRGVLMDWGGGGGGDTKRGGRLSGRWAGSAF